MLNDVQYIQDSIGVNLFYLRSIRDFCISIYLFLPANYTTYRINLTKIGLQAEELGRDFVNASNGKISEKLLNSNIFVTEYTLECEALVQRLFDVVLSLDITETEKNLKPGTLTYASPELINKFNDLNSKADKLLNEFIDLASEIYDSVVENNAFSYSYPSIIEFMLSEARVYEDELDRLNKKEKTDPSEIVNSEFYWNNTMKTISLFINRLVDPSDEIIVKESSEFINKFNESEYLYKKYVLNPENQLFLTNREYSLVSNFKDFMSSVIGKLLSKKTYFIINAIFLDTMYTEINFFLYRLSLNRSYSSINKK